MTKSAATYHPRFDKSTRGRQSLHYGTQACSLCAQRVWNPLRPQRTDSSRGDLAAKLSCGGSRVGCNDKKEHAIRAVIENRTRYSMIIETANGSGRTFTYNSEINLTKM